MTSLMFWNLFTAGEERATGDDRRWRQQVAVIARHRADILCVTEGWRWDADDGRLFTEAMADFGYRHGELYVSKTGCHMAVMWNDPVTLVRMKRQPIAQAWWHGYYLATLDSPDWDEPITVAGTHLNPFDTTLRRIEGGWLRQAVSQYDRAVVVMDANIVAPGDPEPPAHPSTHPVGAERADRTPLAELAAIGLVDVGAAAGDRRPTFGHYATIPRGRVRRHVRLDQVWATPSVRVTGYRVIDDLAADPELDEASDHRPGWVELT